MMAEQGRAAHESNPVSVAGDILANVRHEVRTPLNAILGMIALALEEAPSPQVQDYLETAQASAEGLALLLSDLLDYADVQSGGFRLESRPFYLRETLQHPLAVLAERAHDNGLRFEHTIDERIDERLEGDARRLQQVVLNLVGNAVKFTETGGLRLELMLESESTDTVELRLTVSDSGIGITAEDAERVLAPFVQVDATSTRKYAGVGLGLTIVREIVARMNGRLSLEGDSQQGTRVTCWMRFAIPAKKAGTPADHDANASQAEEEARALRILVAEDTPANQKVVNAILRKRGHSVEIVANGREAVDRLQQSAFDVVLMDAQMPTMNGLQATAAIRRFPDNELARVPIIALTAHTMQGDREKCLAAGMNDFLPKPVDAAILVKTVEYYGRRRRGESESPPDGTSPRPSEN